MRVIDQLQKQLIILIIVAVLCPLFAQAVVINEYMSSNGSTLYDENGDTPDWIELYNESTSAIDLDGYGITDNPSEPYNWVFPSITILPQNHLLIYASGKDRQEWVAHWETIIDWGDNWNYFLGSNAPPENWNHQNFNDAGWASGPSGFGYGDDDDATEVSPVISLYIRREFTINDIESVLKLVLHVDYDDAFVAFINGVEIARANIGFPGVPPANDQGADSWREAEMYQGGAPDEFMITAEESLLDSGANVLAVQVHNFNIGSSDLTLIPFLTLGLDSAPQNAQGLSEHLDVADINLHTNFKISSVGETLVLSSPSGSIQDSISTGIMFGDVSRGRQPDGGVEWLFFGEPTPGTANVTPGYSGVLEAPYVDPHGGPFSNPSTITITTDTPGAEIHYTLDGSFPIEASPLYSGSLFIDDNIILRAIATKQGWLNSRPSTHSYLFDYNGNLPVISLSTNPEHFWDNDSGIYVMGSNATDPPWYYGANFWEDWERPIHIEMFEPNGDLGFSIDAGVKIYGNFSRTLPQKSLVIFARSSYGYTAIDYQIFPDKEIENFEAIVLRNSGNDYNNTHFRDGLVSILSDRTGVTSQAYRPAVVYLNGSYWGIQNIREKINEHFIASHFDVNPDNIDMLEKDNQVIHGDQAHYNDLLNFIETNDMSISDNYSVITSALNADNFIRYNIMQIFIDNWDWPGNNIKYWRSRMPNGHWRWILFDADFSYGLYTPDGYAHNMLQFATNPNGPSETIWGWDPWWPNPPWSTFLLRSLLENQSFKNNFINQFSDLLNTTFQPDEILNTVDEITDLLADEMPNHLVRWGGAPNLWYYNVNTLRNFIFYRSAFMWSHILSYFDLAGTYQLFLGVAGGSGSININSINAHTFPWQGQYFDQIPIQIQAIPDPGFQFVEWDGINNINNSITVTSSIDTTFTAIFEPATYDSSAVVINEINYNSANDYDVQDWVELTNNGGGPINLSGWQFKDEDDSHIFIIPEQTMLENGGFIILAEDTAVFNGFFPGVGPVVGNLNFGLSGGGELIRLYDANGVFIDQVMYDDNYPWPEEADGDGPTLELTNPILDNALPESWAYSNNMYGTPGNENSAYQGLVTENTLPVPTDFMLGQNYPNPFNPRTVIQYEVPTLEHITITIYDILGREVIQLVGGIQEPGYKAIIWDAKNEAGLSVGAGLYFYQLKTTTYVNTKKMVLVR